VRAVNARAYPWTGLDPERRNTLLLYGGLGILVAVALAVIAYGYYTDRIAPKHATVLSVGDRDFDLSFVERRIKAEVRGAPISPQQIGQAIVVVMSEIEREELTRQAAAAKGITLTEAELEAGIREDLSLDETATRNDIAARLRSELVRMGGFPLDEYRDMVRAELLTDRLKAGFEANVPAETEHADLRIFQANTQSDALGARQRIANGESFAAVAASTSVHRSKSSAGELGWIPRGALPQKLEEVAFALHAGSISDIVETDEGFFFLENRGQESRAVTEDGRKQVVDHAFSNLIQQTRDTVGVSTSLTEAQIQRIALDLVSPAVAGG
jgi:parvulin-like peptidyl-prolyl isomerase